MRTDNPIRDFEEEDYIKEMKLERRPKCCACGEHIQTETAIYYNGDYYCDECEDEFLEEVKKDYTVNMED